MTTEQMRQLKSKFEGGFTYVDHFNERYLLPNIDKDDLFDFICSEIEARDKEIKRLSETDDYLRGHVDGFADATVHSDAKIQRLEEIIRAADEAIELHKELWDNSDDSTSERLEKALEHYNNLKKKQ